MSDVQERRASVALSEEHYRSVIDSATDFAIITSDLDGRITSWNPGAEKVLGWTAEDALGRDASMIFTPEDNACGVAAREMRCAAEQGRSEDERWHRRKDGSQFWASGLMMRFEREGDGAHIGYLKILHDRTAQHEAEERRAESESLARAIASSSADCVKTLDLEGRILTMNGPGNQCKMPMSATCCQNPELNLTSIYSVAVCWSVSNRRLTME